MVVEGATSADQFKQTRSSHGDLMYPVTHWWAQTRVSFFLCRLNMWCFTQTSTLFVLAVTFSYSLFCLTYIQGDSGGICETSGNDSMCDCKQKSSYKHVSDFRQLRSYGHFLIPVHALMWTSFALQALPADSPSQCRQKVATPQTSSEWVSGRCEQLAPAVHNRAAACFAFGGGIFENHL